MLLPSGIRWLALAALIANVSLAETSDEHEEQESEENEKFVPTAFTKPSLSAKPLFFDYFPAGEKVGKRWVKSTAKKDGADAEISKYDGEWNIGPPSEVAIEGDHGLIVVNKARHHAIAAKLDKPFVFGEKPLVAQYEVQFEQGQECGGGYIKLLSEGAEQKLDSFQDKTPYTIMFGPDKCGPAGKVHLIFKYRNPKNGSVDEYHAKQPDHISTSYWDDHESHLFTLVVQPSGAYEVCVDQRSLFYGNMLQNLHPSLTPPEMIADPEDKKPEDWDERAEIEDETAVKPDDWDEAQPKEVIDVAATKPDDWLEDEAILIPDPNAVRPSDWDDEMDGEWEAPMIENPACQGKSGCGPWKAPTIPNPLYKGKWRRPKIANPAFKGIWAPRQIANPNFFEPTPFGGLAPVTALGIELWTMSERIIFDNILIADDEALATEVATQTFTVRRKEADRLAVSKGEKNGFLASIVSATEERPWLWVVFALAIILPVIGIAVCCCGRKSTQPVTAADALRKKTDAIVPDDDEVPNLVGDDDSVEEGGRVEEVEMEKPAAPSRSRSASRSRSRSRNASRSPARKTVESEKKLTMADLEDDDDEEEEEVEKAKTESSAEPSPKPSPKASPKPTTATKRKPRKAE